MVFDLNFMLMEIYHFFDNSYGLLLVHVTSLD
jgi:hypothetical protein